ncbi:MAG: Redoxin [Pseudomonadota bacterium]|jgi:thiol-disulfide isomerase/thioredoxin
MRTLLAAVGLLAAPFAEAVADPSTQTFDRLGQFVVRQPAPSIAGWRLDGTLFRSKVEVDGNHGLVVTFFQTTCAPCVVGLPKILGTVASTEGRYRVLMVNVGERPELIEPFLARYHLQGPVLVDATQALRDGLGLDSALPRTIVIGPDGTVRAILGEEGVDFLTLLQSAMSPGR